MADKSPIEWTNASWNPVRGCSRVSEGCRNCYAEIMAARFSGPGQWGEGLATMVRSADGKTDHRWTGKVVAAPDHVLTQPLRWRKPRRIFVNSTSDLFHEGLPDAVIDRVFAVMALCPQHTFQVLTKRPERMRAYFAGIRDRHIGWLGARPLGAWVIYARAEALASNLGSKYGGVPFAAALNKAKPKDFHLMRDQWPLPNVWLGTSVEDQATADARIPHLLDTPAAVRFISAEPLLGPVDLHSALCRETGSCPTCPACLGGIHWVIVGGESGPGARPMHPDWARSLRGQCAAAGVPFFFKQWGEWAPNESQGADYAQRIGKCAAGRLLDGVTHDAMPGEA